MLRNLPKMLLGIFQKFHYYVRLLPIMLVLHTGLYDLLNIHLFTSRFMYIHRLLRIQFCNVLQASLYPLVGASIGYSTMHALFVN